MIVQIRIMTEGRGDPKDTQYLDSEWVPKAAQQGVKMLHHVAERIQMPQK